MSTTIERTFFEKALDFGSCWSVTELVLEKDKKEAHIYLSYTQDSYLDEHTGERHNIYDYRKERKWQHLPVLGYSTWLHCRLPRVSHTNGKKVTIPIPWADNQDSFTHHFSDHVIELLQSTHNKTATARLAHTSYEKVHRIMEKSVERGLARRSLSQTTRLGLDEKCIGRGHQYATLLVDTTEGRVLDVGLNRDGQSVKSLIESTLSEQQRSKVKSVSMDMWEPYMKVVKTLMPKSDVVHDKFHLVKYLNKAVDDTRKTEVKREALLRKSKYVLLKNTSKHTDQQALHFEQIMQANLLTAQAWVLAQQFKETVLNPEQTNLARGQAYFDMWVEKAEQSALKAIRKLAKTFQKHAAGIINYIKHKVTNALVERINGKVQNLNQVARGYTSFRNFRIAVLFFNGKLSLFSHN